MGRALLFRYATLLAQTMFGSLQGKRGFVDSPRLTPPPPGPSGPTTRNSTRLNNGKATTHLYSSQGNNDSGALDDVAPRCAIGRIESSAAILPCVRISTHRMRGGSGSETGESFESTRVGERVDSCLAGDVISMEAGRADVRRPERSRSCTANAVVLTHCGKSSVG